MKGKTNRTAVNYLHFKVGNIGSLNQPAVGFSLWAARPKDK
jgi:hypothetical protein